MKIRMPWLVLAAALCMAVPACGGEEKEDERPLTIDDPGPLAAETLRVAVIDDVTRRPVLDAVVVANLEGQSGSRELTLKDNGRYELKKVPDAKKVTVSVFHSDYNYVTAAGLSERDLLISVRRLATSRRGGITGTLANWPDASDNSTLAVGITSLALQGSILDFDPDVFRGDQVDTTFDFPSWMAPLVKNFSPDSSTTFDVKIPGSVMFGKKTDFSVFGLPSPCGSASSEMEGSCGRQAAFGAYASVSGYTDPIVQELYTDEAQALIAKVVATIDDGAELNLQELLPTALPLLPKLLSHVKVDYARDISLDFGGADQALQERDFDLARSFSLKRSVTVPMPPQLMDKEHADLVGVIALADLGSQGLLPIGLGASDTGSSLTVDMVLADGGITFKNATNKLVAIALDSSISSAVHDKSIVPVFSALLGTYDSLPEGGAAMSGAFLESPEESAFSSDIRTFFQTPDVKGADLYRAEIKGGNRQWVVYFDRSSDLVALPEVPEGMEDVIQVGKDAHTMIAISLKDSLTMDNLFKDSEANVSDLNDLMTGFSYAVHYE